MVQEAARLPRPAAAAAGLLLVAGLLLGLLVVRYPELLHLEEWLTPEPGGEAVSAPLGFALLGLGLGLALLVVRSPGLGLVLLAAAVFLNLSQVLVRFHRLPSLLQFLILPIALAAWSSRNGKQRARLFAHPLSLAVLVYTAWSFVSSAWARDPALADERLAELARSLAVFLLVALLAASAARIRLLAATLLAAGSLLSLLSIVQTLSGDFDNEWLGLARIKHAQIYGDVFEPRLAGPLGDPNFYAQILVPLVPLALFAAWGARRRASRLLGFAAAALLVAAIVLTYSRGAALALALVVALSFLSHGVTPRQVLLAAGAGAVLLALFLPADFARRLATVAELLPGDGEVLRPDASFQKRKLLQAAAWRMFLDHPVAGVGIGGYSARFEAYADEVGSIARDYEDADDRHYPHNHYLEVAAETGLVGLAALGVLLAAAFAATRAGRARGFELARAVEIGLLGHLVTALFLHAAFPRYLMLLLGLAAALSLADRDDRGPAPAEAP